MGLGASIAEAFARFGADLALCDRAADPLAQTAAALQTHGQQVETAVLDVRDAEAVASFVQAAAARSGFAGTTPRVGPRARGAVHGAWGVCVYGGAGDTGELEIQGESIRPLLVPWPAATELCLSVAFF